MATVPLVENQIDNGQQLLDRLAEAGVAVRAASWMKRPDQDRWTLYIATPNVDEKGQLDAYRQLRPVLRSLGDEWVTSSDVNLVGENDPLVKDVLDLLRRYPHKAPIVPPRTLMGRIPVEEVYVYPLAKTPVTLYHLVYPGAPGVVGILSLDPSVLDSRFFVEMETPEGGKVFQGKAGIDCLVVAPEGARLERNEFGEITLAWDLHGKPQHSSANEVWSLANLRLHGFRLLPRTG